MKKVNKNNRKKAFWGSLITAGIGTAINGILSGIEANNQRVFAENQYLAQKDLLQRQEIQNKYFRRAEDQIASQENDKIYDELRRKYYKCGGKIVKRKKAEFGFDSMMSGIGESIIGGIGNLIQSGLNNRTRNIIAGYETQLLNDKLSLANKKDYSYAGNSGLDRLKEYIAGDKISDKTANGQKNAFQNKWMYLS